MQRATRGEGGRRPSTARTRIAQHALARLLSGIRAIPAARVYPAREYGAPKAAARAARTPAPTRGRREPARGALAAGVTLPRAARPHCALGSPLRPRPRSSPYWAARRLSPRLRKPQRGRLSRCAASLDHAQAKAVFATLPAYSVNIDVQSITVSADTAVANCRVTYQPTPKPPGPIQTVPIVFRLRRLRDVWLIQSATMTQQK